MLVSAVVKFREVTPAILPPAHWLFTLTFTILATLLLLLPTKLGLGTMVKVAPSYPCIPAVADSKLKGRVCANPTLREAVSRMARILFIFKCNAGDIMEPGILKVLANLIRVQVKDIGHGKMHASPYSLVWAAPVSSWEASAMPWFGR